MLQHKSEDWRSRGMNGKRIRRPRFSVSVCEPMWPITGQYTNETQTEAVRDEISTNTRFVPSSSLSRSPTGDTNTSKVNSNLLPLPCFLAVFGVVWFYAFPKNASQRTLRSLSRSFCFCCIVSPLKGELSHLIQRGVKRLDNFR